MSKNLEICLNADDHINLVNNIKTAFNAGANRIELCSAMHVAGLSPTAHQIESAVKVLPTNGELLVMIRPIDNYFNVDAALLKTMIKQISEAAYYGATGVVFGVIDGNELDIESTTALVKCAKHYRLSTTFHRAFDCIADSNNAIDVLKSLGVDRVLTNGTPWMSNKGVMDGLSKIQSLIQHAKADIEIVIGGGVTTSNSSSLWSLGNGKLISLHAYSGVLDSSGLVDPLLVTAILNQGIMDKRNG